MTHSFDILHPGTSPHLSMILEASAGTGKTFLIENLITRRMIEPHPRLDRRLQINEILVVTFTKAATRELKTRVRKTLYKTLSLLLAPELPDSAPEYLRQCDRKEAIKYLKRALNAFDEAQIFTIHGFCARMLHEFGQSEEMLGEKELDQLIHHFITSIITEKNIHPSQYSLDESLFSFLRKHIDNFIPSDPGEPPINQFLAFHKRLNAFVKEGDFSKDFLLEDYRAERKIRNKYPSKSAEELEAAGEAFAELLAGDSVSEDQTASILEEGFSFFYSLDPGLISKRKTNRENILHYPGLYKKIHQELEPYYRQSIDKGAIQRWMVLSCLKHIGIYLEKEGKNLQDTLLKKMALALDQASIRNSIQSRYACAIVDEFQDTDPIQWEILSKLFRENRETHDLILVGDPKQAIYSFRQADIYTYLRARQSFDESQKQTLGINYRSSKVLVAAINALFSEENNPGLIRLPLLQDHLPYKDVEAFNPNISNCPDKKALHFLILPQCRNLDEECLIPYLTHEIQRLVDREGYSLKDIALLVNDRHVGATLSDGLHRAGIPASTQKLKNLTDSQSVLGMIEWIEALLHPRDGKTIRRFLGGIFLRIPLEIIEQLENLEEARAIEQVNRLREIAESSGIAHCFEEALHSPWFFGQQSLLEEWMQRPKGLELYRETRQLIAVLADYETKQHATLQTLHHYLLEFRNLSSEENHLLKILDDPDRDAVRIMTAHYSKGLEFPVVFAVGLCRSKKEKPLFIRKPGSQEIVLANEDEETCALYLDELDAEKIRLAYVALTRAKDRLYIPVDNSKDSPIQLLLKNFHTRSTHECAVDRLKAFIDHNQNSLSISYEALNPPLPKGSFHAIKPKLNLIPPPKPTVIAPSILLRSYSQIAKSTAHSTPSGEPPRLPPGRVTGILIHSLFEKLNFNALQTLVDVEREISPHLKSHPLQEFKTEIAGLLYRTLHTPLFSFTLSEIPSSKSFKEVDFMMDDAPSGYLRGTIDYLFEHNDSIYLVDWKTNWLEDYSQERLKEAMKQHHYTLQANIYREAAKRYMSCYQKKKFGGILYLFVRGMDPKIGMDQGVYCIQEEKQR